MHVLLALVNVRKSTATSPPPKNAAHTNALKLRTSGFAFFDFFCAKMFSSGFSTSTSLKTKRGSSSLGSILSGAMKPYGKHHKQGAVMVGGKPRMWRNTENNRSKKRAHTRTQQQHTKQATCDKASGSIPCKRQKSQPRRHAMKWALWRALS